MFIIRTYIYLISPSDSPLCQYPNDTACGHVWTLFYFNTHIYLQENEGYVSVSQMLSLSLFMLFILESGKTQAV